MTISIIIPAYNSERFLRSTVQSVIAQSVTDWELVIVDDGSKDSTPQILEELARQEPRIRTLRQENGGIAAARNRGYKEIDKSSDYVIYLDHDDIWEPNALEVLLDTLNSHPDAPAAYGMPRCINGDGETVQAGWLEDWHLERTIVKDRELAIIPIEAPTSFAVEICQNRITTMGQVLIRRGNLDRLAPPFHSRMVPCDDWDLYLRLAQTGDLIFLPKIVVAWRMHGSNTSGDRTVMSASETVLRKAYARSNSLSPEHTKLARESYALWSSKLVHYRLTWARESFKEGKLVTGAKQLRHAAILAYRLFWQSDRVSRAGRTA